MPSEASQKADLLAAALLTHDYYALLSIPLVPAPTQKQIHKAWRLANLKHHPDKAGATNLVARESLHLATLARDVLCDEEARRAYENAREARERGEKRKREMHARRAGLREDLERRESAGGWGFQPGGGGGGGKRKWDDGVGDEERRVKALAEEGRRRRVEREADLRRKAEEEEGRHWREERGSHHGGSGTPSGKGSAQLPFGIVVNDGSTKTTPARPSLGAAGGSPGSKALLEKTLRRLKEAERRRSGLVGVVKEDEVPNEAPNGMPDGVGEEKGEQEEEKKKKKKKKEDAA